MDKAIVTKVTRFIELSNKFSKSIADVFPIDNSNHHSYISGPSHMLTVNGSGSITWNQMCSSIVIDGRELYIEDGVVKAKDKKVITRADTIRAEAEAKAQLSDEFDEYNKLRFELAEYFAALKKITE